MAEPKRIQRKRTNGWRIAPGTIYVGRPGRWGNPFHSAAEFEEAISTFPVPPGWVASWRRCGGRMDMLIALAGRVRPILDELRGHDLGCWCHLCDAHRDGLPVGVACPDCARCHGDVLLELANAPPVGNGESRGP